MTVHESSCGATRIVPRSHRDTPRKTLADCRLDFCNIILEELYGLKGLNYAKIPLVAFFKLCVYCISVTREIGRVEPPEYVSNRI
eukprot:COSAG01_NODE_27538_length_683_cov_0.940068_1_plen_85_part_00